MCFNEAVVDVLFCCKHGLASWQVHPLKLTIKHIFISKRVLILMSCDSITIRSQSVGCHWGVTKY